VSGVDTRNINRDSLFLMAELRVDGESNGQRVKVRNLSSGGMMAEGEIKVVRGSRVTVDLKNVGQVEGNVAWVQENRCGIAFAREIDPRAPRTAVGNNDLATPRFVRPATILPAGVESSSGAIRKI
jgi:hypothetical protein